MGQSFSTALPNGNKTWTPELRWEVKRFIERRFERNIQHKVIFIETAKEFGRSTDSIRSLWRDIQNGTAELPSFAVPSSDPVLQDMTPEEFGLPLKQLAFCNLGQAITAIETDFNRMLQANRNLRRQVEKLQNENSKLSVNQMDNSLLFNQETQIKELELRVIELKGELDIWQSLANDNESKVQSIEQNAVKLQSEYNQVRAELNAIYAGARDHFLSLQDNKTGLSLVR